VDVGGPGRELVAEAAADLCAANCGLVVPIPNDVAGAGELRDLVVPYPKQAIAPAQLELEFAGALIAIAMRSGLAQDFRFPPLVWEYLVTRQVRLPRIFEIDQAFAALMTSLEEAQKEGVNDADFAVRFNLSFVVLNSRMEEVALVPGGRSRRVRASDLPQFIALATEWRLRELRGPLEALAKGFWENLNFAPPAGVGWRCVEFLACGRQGIELETLRSIATIHLPEDRERRFWSACARLTPEELGMLLKFATGRSRLPPGRLRRDEDLFVVDSDEGTDRLPTASTCFNKLHLPRYTTDDKCLIALRAAINFAGSFDRS
jgi:hypothetical protein